MNMKFRNISGYKFVIIAVGIAVYLGASMCDTLNSSDRFTKIKHANGKIYAGSETCKSCHADIVRSYRLTAHFNTSAVATTDNIRGSFDSATNYFRYNTRMEVDMEKRNGKAFQVAYIGGKEWLSAPFDIIIGSGNKGQTYLYWNKKTLFQLPVSFYAPLNEWCNSPGFPSDMILFNRIIPGQCMECHTTAFKTLSVGENRETYEVPQAIYGIDCERCHGPSAEHVSFHLDHPEAKEGGLITRYLTLNRQQKLDACAMCHSGLRKAIKSSFAFLPGDQLNEYSLPNYNIDTAALLDVHGNQYGLLAVSKCFKVSGTMNCSTCHNVHVKESERQEQVFSKRCISCHTSLSHSFDKQGDPGLADNKCIDCHMPALPSAKIFMSVTGKEQTVADLIRTHRIAIYPEETKKIIKAQNYISSKR